MKKCNVLIIILLSIWIINMCLAYIFENNRGSPIEDITNKEEIDYGTNFALMIEQDDGTYIESTSTKWPENYKLNLEKSKCIDKDGNILNDVLTENNNTIQVKTKTTCYCYLYFDKDLNNVVECTNPSKNVNCRYVGIDPDNYICFGTTSKEECVNNPNKYMYRIIGKFEGTDGYQHLKLIKKEAIDDYTFAGAKITKLNADAFLENTSYVPTNWSNKIEIWEYTVVNSQTYENSGPNYNNLTSQSVYLHEMNKESKTSSKGVWETLSVKIGLMYVSDYMFSLGNSALSYISDNDYAILKTGWMHISNNDSGALSSDEWTLAEYGKYADGFTNRWFVNSSGKLSFGASYLSNAVRPVFYLTDDTTITSGEGTIEDPYMIYNSINVEDLSCSKLIDEDGCRYIGTNPNNYICFGYDNASEDCDFTNATNTDLYAYRIIGIFEDSSGEQHLKLIKKEALNTAYAWDTFPGNYFFDVTDLYKGLNGISGGDYSNLFVDNDTYSYMSTSSAWYNKIATWNYSAMRKDVGLNGYINTIKDIYKYEMGIDQTKTSDFFKTFEGKISVMYLSDYLLSLGVEVLDYIPNSNASTLKTGWMHLSNNDSSYIWPGYSLPPNEIEWTMTYWGQMGEYYDAWIIRDNGIITDETQSSLISVRPVFYLISDIELTGGGTIENPYIITN